jgi:SAM-dependent methyltransferase
VSPVASATRSPLVDSVAPLTPMAWLRYDLVRRMLPAGVTRVLEVGCGQGALAARLATDFSYLGVEPDQESCAVASKRLALVGAGEVRNLAFDDLGEQDFDLVCAFEVLEHIEDDAGAVRDWASRLRPGGWLLLSVPAYQSRFSAADEYVGHYRRYDPAVLASVLGAAKFTDVTIRHYGMPLGYLLESVRTRITQRRLRRTPGATQEERTSGSGRLFQPSGLTGVGTRLGTAPFRLLQRAFPGRGTGLVALARWPG